jgi:hypothetical protein
MVPPQLGTWQRASLALTQALEPSTQKVDVSMVVDQVLKFVKFQVGSSHV